MPGPGPDQPGQALPGGTPHAVPGVPGHPIVTNPAQSSSERLTWPTSVVCDNRVDGNIEIPSGGYPQGGPGRAGPGPGAARALFTPKKIVSWVIDRGNLIHSEDWGDRWPSDGRFWRLLEVLGENGPV